MELPDIQLETRLWKEGYSYVFGLDEVGRGPLAGPVVAACVCITNKEQVIDGVRDSKKISEKNRIILNELIIEKSTAYGIGVVSEKEIDQLNIRQATKLAMIRAIQYANEKFNIIPDYLIADGGINLIENYNMLSINKGDVMHYSISAASIIAKVYRDNIMKEYSIKYPEYGFDKHVGYGTKQHIDAIYKYGVLDIHRKTFAPISKLVV